MKKEDKKAIIILVLILIVLASYMFSNSGISSLNSENKEDFVGMAAPKSLLIQANQEYSTGNYLKAADLFQQVIANGGDSSTNIQTLYLRVGESYRLGGKFSKAFQNMQKAKELASQKSKYKVDPYLADLKFDFKESLSDKSGDSIYLVDGAERTRDKFGMWSCIKCNGKLESITDDDVMAVIFDSGNPIESSFVELTQVIAPVPEPLLASSKSVKASSIDNALEDLGESNPESTIEANGVTYTKRDDGTWQGETAQGTVTLDDNKVAQLCKTSKCDIQLKLGDKTRTYKHDPEVAAKQIEEKRKEDTSTLILIGILDTKTNNDVITSYNDGDDTFVYNVGDTKGGHSYYKVDGNAVYTCTDNECSETERCYKCKIYKTEDGSAAILKDKNGKEIVIGTKTPAEIKADAEEKVAEQIKEKVEPKPESPTSVDKSEENKAQSALVHYDDEDESFKYIGGKNNYKIGKDDKIYFCKDNNDCTVCAECSITNEDGSVKLKGKDGDEITIGKKTPAEIRAENKEDAFYDSSDSSVSSTYNIEEEANVDLAGVFYNGGKGSTADYKSAIDLLKPLAGKNNQVKLKLAILYRETGQYQEALDIINNMDVTKLSSTEKSRIDALAQQIISKNNEDNPGTKLKSVTLPSQLAPDGSIKYATKVGDITYQVAPGTTDVQRCEKDKCSKCEKCTIKNGKLLDKDGKPIGDSPEALREKAEDYCIKNLDDTKCDYVSKGLSNAVNIATAPFRAEVERVVGSYMNTLLDMAWIGSNRNFLMAMCGAKYYEKEGESIGALGGAIDSWKSPVSYGMKDPNDVIYDGLLSGENNIIKTSGTKEEITPEMYRYTARVLLIGNFEYTIYFKNSCTEETSLFEGGFVKQGVVQTQAAPDYNIDQYSDYYSGSLTTFDCSKGPCRFDQICIDVEPAANKNGLKVIKIGGNEYEPCQKLAKGKFRTKFKEGKPDESGSVEC